MTDIPNEGELGSLSMLKDYGYTTCEEVFFLAQAIGPELAQMVGMPPADLMARLAPSLNLPAQADMDAVALLELPLGVPLECVPTSPFLASPVTSAISSSVNLISQFPLIRSQGQRGTCVAHAAIAVLEHSLFVIGASADLSEQFLYWDCKQNDGRPNLSGTWVKTAFDLIFRDGACPESVWPYQALGCGSEGCGPPPAGAITSALPYRHQVRPVSPKAVGDIKAILDGGRSVAFSIPVFRSWLQNIQVRLDGKINMPVPNDIVEGGHAMTFVGYADSADPGIGGGRFVIRNSWGQIWAAQSPFGAGYGSIPYAYIARYGMEAYCLA